MTAHPVTPLDRQAAVDLRAARALRGAGQRETRAAIMAGECDDAADVQAFARHRPTASTWDPRDDAEVAALLKAWRAAKEAGLRVVTFGLFDPPDG